MTDGYIDIREVHPDYWELECWNCGATEWVGPNRHMRICHNCFMDNKPADYDTDYTVEGPDGNQYVDYRLLWFGDVSITEAQERYEEDTRDVRKSAERTRARDRAVRL